jgi:voltage-gated potassium channel
MARPDRHWVAAIVFSAVLIILISFALVDAVNGFVLVMLLSMIGAVSAFYRLFPGSRFVSIAFANFIAIYAYVFIFFTEANFAGAHFEVVLLGFTLPILAFLVGAWRRRNSIRAIVTATHLREERHFGHVLLWLAPVFAIGAVSFLAPGYRLGPLGSDISLLAAMAAISAVVLFVSRDVSTFLLDTGLLFEEFFERMAALIVPAFAFFTFYSLLVIVFGAVYRITDHLSPEALFRVNGELQKISFAEALYFSIVTLSTVGYGDIVPAANLSRMIVGVQITCGLLLLLFGFSEIISYRRDRRQHERRRTES